MGSFGFCILNTVDQIAVSVGPYIFQTLETLLNNFSPKSLGIASPPHNTFNFFDPFHAEANKIRHVVGVACIMVGSYFNIALTNNLPSMDISLGMITVA